MQRQFIHRSSLLWVMVVAFVMCAGVLTTHAKQSDPQPTSTKDTGQYSGSDSCTTCHEDFRKNFISTPHTTLLKEEKNDAAKAHGCESCHGAGSAHIEGGGDVTKITSFKKLTVEEANQRCLACHSYSNNHSNFARSAHASNNVGCLSCHSVHNAKTDRSLLVAKQPALCYQCHTEQKAEFMRASRHRVNEGLVLCSDCHNEHGGFLAKSMNTASEQDQVCFKCHTDKKGPYVYEHLPVKSEGCTSCHTPHGSSNPRLLRVSQVNLLCLQCHTMAQSAVLSQPPIGPAHNQAQKYQACTMCHSFIHGSNFSNVFFKN